MTYVVSIYDYVCYTRWSARVVGNFPLERAPPKATGGEAPSNVFGKEAGQLVGDRLELKTVSMDQVLDRVWDHATCDLTFWPSMVEKQLISLSLMLFVGFPFASEVQSPNAITEL